MTPMPDMLHYPVAAAGSESRTRAAPTAGVPLSLFMTVITCLTPGKCHTEKNIKYLITVTVIIMKYFNLTLSEMPVVLTGQIINVRLDRPKGALVYCSTQPCQAWLLSGYIQSQRLSEEWDHWVVRWHLPQIFMISNWHSGYVIEVPVLPGHWTGDHERYLKWLVVGASPSLVTTTTNLIILSSFSAGRTCYGLDWSSLGPPAMIPGNWDYIIKMLLSFTSLDVIKLLWGWRLLLVRLGGLLAPDWSRRNLDNLYEARLALGTILLSMWMRI